MNRRDVLVAGAASLLVRAPALAAAGTAPAMTTTLAAPQPMAQIHASRPGDLLAVSTTGTLWQLGSHDITWRRLADDIDTASPVASGHGRFAARHARGGLWVWANGRATLSGEARLAPNAGLCILPFGIIGVTDVAGQAHVARFEPDREQRWLQSTRGTEPVLPDARPRQVDLATTQGDDDGQIVVLAGPDADRYTHGALGDTVECTRVLYLERHGLQIMRSLTLPPPFVLEDIAPRPIAWRGGRGLLTMRSGPQGSQLAVIAASSSGGDALEIAALGAPIGTPNRWMAASTDGHRLVAVHTPHIGGVLHEYQADGITLRSRVIGQGLTSHRNGTRELDLATWVNGKLLVPAQDRRSLASLDADQRWNPGATVPLPGRVTATAAWSRRNRAGAVVLMEDGQLLFAVIGG
jgi:hypothetical protein